MERYIALFRKDKDSDYGVEFPDIPGCFSAGSDLNEARAMAAEALRGHLDLLKADGDPIPVASSLREIVMRLGSDAEGEDFVALLEVEAEPHKERFVRVNVTFEQSLLEHIDAAARIGHTTRSGYLSALARQDIKGHRGKKGHTSSPN